MPAVPNLFVAATKFEKSVMVALGAGVIAQANPAVPPAPAAPPTPPARAAPAGDDAAVLASGPRSADRLGPTAGVDHEPAADHHCKKPQRPGRRRGPA